MNRNTQPSKRTIIKLDNRHDGQQMQSYRRNLFIYRSNARPWACMDRFSVLFSSITAAICRLRASFSFRSSLILSRLAERTRCVTVSTTPDIPVVWPPPPCFAGLDPFWRPVNITNTFLFLKVKLYVASQEHVNQSHESLLVKCDYSHKTEKWTEMSAYTDNRLYRSNMSTSD